MTQVHRVKWRLLSEAERGALTILSGLTGEPIAEAIVNCLDKHAGNVRAYAATTRFDSALEALTSDVAVHAAREELRRRQRRL